MLNLIKMNLYRLFKTRVFYVMLLTTVILTGLLAGMETESASTFGEFYASFASSGYVLIMVGVFAIVFSEEERKSGFLKNLLTTRSGKKNIFLAKIPVVFLYSLFMFLGELVASWFGSLFWAPGIYFGRIGSLISFITFEVMLHTVFGIAMMALYEITRNTIIPTIITIFGSANLHGMLISFLETKLVSRIPALAGFMDKYGLSRNFIVTKTEDLGISGVSVSYVNIIVVIVIGLILYSVMGTFIFTKRDTI